MGRLVSLFNPLSLLKKKKKITCIATIAMTPFVTTITTVVFQNVHYSTRYLNGIKKKRGVQEKGMFKIMIIIVLSLYNITFL
jgi:hypothetical protein